MMISKKLKLGIGIAAVVLISPLILGLALSKELILSRAISEHLEVSHYSGIDINDAFSKKAFDGFFEDIDPLKRILTQEDINSLSSYRLKLDDELKTGSTAFFEEVYKLYDKRLAELEVISTDLLSKPLDLRSQDKLESDSKKRAFPKDQAEQYSLWKKQLTYQTAVGYLNLIQNKGKTNVKLLDKIDPKLEQKAREKVQKELKQWFATVKKEKRKDKLSHYFSALTNQFDPHTNYLPTDEKENFDISMTGTLEGIGAVLQEEDGTIKVTSIVVGGPAWKQKELKADDKILKVAQGNGDFVDISGMRVNDAVKLIRGKKGTLVRLSVQKPHGETQIIPIIRDVVVLEETYARSAVVQIKGKPGKYGYIYLPVFYRNFSDKKARNSSDDVRKEIEKLEKLGVEGIILDLRNNSGGALDDAIKMSGLFFKTGPVVQVRNRDDERQILEDPSPSVEYSGPLVVLVNEFSASASEILAAALQDYKRAVIVGSKHTFGKGTVQTLINLDDGLPYPMFFAKPLGSLKLTIQKFYRINGGTTQYKGVTSDVILPDPYEDINSGERTLSRSLKWDTIDPLTYSTWPVSYNITALQTKSRARLANNKAFSIIRKTAQRLKEQQDDSTVVLHVKKLWEDQEFLKSQKDALKKVESSSIIVSSSSPQAQLSKEETDKQKEWNKNIAKDLYIQESMDVLGDMIRR
jgi:carboxyl-terminal processing protease